MNGNENGITERLLEKPYSVIDFLPRRVSADGEGRFFEVEKYYLKGEEAVCLRRKFADILLRLNCYCSFEVFCGDDAGTRDPAPELLVQRIIENREHINILLTSSDALISLGTDDTHMTVYNASGELLSLLGQIAAACGMFLWR